jgi:hypothetical protein
MLASSSVTTPAARGEQLTEVLHGSAQPAIERAVRREVPGFYSLFTVSSFPYFQLSTPKRVLVFESPDEALMEIFSTLRDAAPNEEAALKEFLEVWWLLRSQDISSCSELLKKTVSKSLNGRRFLVLVRGKDRYLFQIHFIRGRIRNFSLDSQERKEVCVIRSAIYFLDKVASKISIMSENNFAIIEDGRLIMPFDSLFEKIENALRREEAGFTFLIQ